MRWAVQQSGPRVVKFGVAGTIALKGTLVVREPFLTIDGSDAPGDGICLRDHSLNFENTHDIVVRYIRIRRGDVETLKAVAARRVMSFEWSFLLDALQTERDQGITIDTSQIRFRTPSREVLLIDAPGHAEASTRFDADGAEATVSTFEPMRTLWPACTSVLSAGCT